MAASDRDLERRLAQLEDEDRAASRAEAMARLKSVFDMMSDVELGEWAVSWTITAETLGDEAGERLNDPLIPSAGYARWVELGGLDAFLTLEHSLAGASPEAQKRAAAGVFACYSHRSRVIGRALREHRQAQRS